jgi:hypothetical protein
MFIAAELVAQIEQKLSGEKGDNNDEQSRLTLNESSPVEQLVKDVCCIVFPQKQLHFTL